MFDTKIIPQITPEYAKSLKRYPNIYLYVRIAENAEDEIASTVPVIDNQGLYGVPYNVEGSPKEPYNPMNANPLASPYSNAHLNPPAPSFHSAIPKNKLPSTHPASPAKQNFTIYVTAKNLKHFPCSRPIKISIAILEGGQIFIQPNGTQAMQVSQPYTPPPVSKGGLDPVKKPLSAAGMQLMMKKSQVQQKEELIQKLKMSAMAAPMILLGNSYEFSGPFYYLKNAPNHPGFWLVFQIFEQAPPRTGMPGSMSEENFEPIAYSAIDLFNSTSQRIENGEFTVNLYNFPLSLPPMPSAELPSQITFTISDIPVNMPPSAYQPGSKPQSAQYPSADASVIVNDNKFLPADVLPGEGFIFYVDSMRFIPECTGPLKVCLRGYTRNLERFCTEIAMYPECTSKVNMPVYRNMRPQYLPKINPTSIMLASLEMFDEVSQKDKIFGYFAINLFVDGESHKPIEDVTAMNYKLLEGAFQIPIYCENPLLSSPFNMKKITELDTVPCASVLIRIQKMPIGYDVTQYKQPPTYESGLYLTNYINITPEEKEWMVQKRMDPSRTIRDVIDKWKLKEGHNKDMVFLAIFMQKLRTTMKELIG